MNQQMLIMIVVMILAFWGLSRFSRSQQKKMLAEQERRTNEALVPGNWVRTRAGFYGTVVEVSGDVVTLATPLGDESLWAKASIVGSEEPPFAAESEVGDGDESEAGDGNDTEHGDAAEPEAGDAVESEAGDGDDTVDSVDSVDTASAAGDATDSDDEAPRT